MPYEMSASKRFSTVCVLLSLYLSHLLVKCATEHAHRTDSVTDSVTDAVTETEAASTGFTEGAAQGVTIGVANRVGNRFPNPWQYPEQCRRLGAEKSWFCDVDGVISKDQADSIDSLLTNINANASCVCNCSGNHGNSTLQYADDEGYVIGVAVVTSLDEDLSVANRTYHLEVFGDTVRQDWFGNRTCDDSALILAHYMYNCSKIYMSIGDAFDGLLSGQSLSAIYDAGQPSLDTGNVGQAITLTVQKLNAAINQAMIPMERPPPNNLVWGILGVIAISSILLFHYWIKY